jgi:hypothetical protein
LPPRIVSPIVDAFIKRINRFNVLIKNTKETIKRIKPTTQRTVLSFLLINTPLIPDTIIAIEPTIDRNSKTNNNHFHFVL